MALCDDMSGMMSVLQHRRAFNDLGHPLCDNLRQGNWLMEYTANRLIAYPATNAVRLATFLLSLYQRYRHHLTAYVQARP